VVVAALLAAWIKGAGKEDMRNIPKEHGILFSAQMVRAILDGHKTQTRRSVNPQPDRVDQTGVYLLSEGDDGAMFRRNIKCPHPVGTRLWVRETWSPDHQSFYPHFRTVYRANWDVETEDGEVYSPEARAYFPFKWRPSIHMPRWASRITLEVTGVRVQRLQDLSDIEAQAEGIRRRGPDIGWHWETGYGEHYQAPRYAFQALWKQVNGPNSWAVNPWVWAYTFKKVRR
jgi:hypothetical protein